MPILYLPSVNCPIASTMAVEQSRVKKNIGRGSISRISSTVDLNQSGRIRSGISDLIEVRAKSSGGLKQKLLFRPNAAALVSAVNVVSFVATIPAAPPEGTVHQTTIAGLINNANSPRLTGARLVRGDLEPVSFKLMGQRLAGLEAEFVAKPRNTLLGLPTITKSSVKLTAPSIDPATNVETMMGQFAIDPQDTIALPDQEIEYVYQLKMSDGNGRVYTVEMGFFTVYPPLV